YICKACRNKIPIMDIEGIFLDEVQSYSVSPDRIAAYLQQANATLAEKGGLLDLQQTALQKVQEEIGRVYKLYQEGRVDSAAFGNFYKPLEERKKQIESDLPRLQAEIDVCKISTLSAQEVASEAQN